MLAFAPAPDAPDAQAKDAPDALRAKTPAPEAALAAWRDAGATVWIDAGGAAPDALEALAAAFGLEDVPVLPAAAAGTAARPRPRLVRYTRSAALRIYVPHPGTLSLFRTRVLSDQPPGRGRRRPGARRRGGDSDRDPGAPAGAASLTLLDPLLVVFGRRFLLTVHDHPLPLLDGVAERAAAAGPPTAATLLHDVLVAQLDASGDVLDHLAELAESREAATYETGQRAQRALQSLTRVRRDLFTFRRIATAQRSALTVLARDPGIVPREPGAGEPPAFEDVLDRAVRLEQAIAVQHSLLLSARAAHNSWVAAGVTRVTRILLVTTCLIALPTLLVTVYGMNFPGLPELRLGIGPLWAVLVALAADGALWLYLRRRGWV